MKQRTASAFSPRAALLGAGIAVLTGLVHPWVESAMGGNSPAGHILPIMPFALFALLALGNPLWRARALTPMELLVVFGLSFGGASVCTRITPVLGYIATPAGQALPSDVQEYALPILSPHYRLRDEEVAKAFYTGQAPSPAEERARLAETVRALERRAAERALSRIEQQRLDESRARAAALSGQTAADAAHWRRRVVKAWLPPLANWAVLLGGLVAFSIGFTSILRRQWLENERVPTPLLEAPLLIAEGCEGRPILRNRAFVTGLAAGLAYAIWNTAAALVPALPAFTLQHEAWEHVFGTRYSAAPNPIVILRVFIPVMAVAFFVRRDILFSVVFFWALSAAAGRYMDATSTFVNQSYLWEGNAFNCNTNWIAMGAFLGYGCVTLFMARRFLGQVARHAIGRGPPLDESGEWIGYRAAILAAAAGLLVFWLALRRLGIGGGLSGGLVAAAAIMLVAAARVVTETGLVFFRTPISLIDGAAFALRHTFARTWTSVAGLISAHVFLAETRNFAAQALVHNAKLAGRLPEGAAARRRWLAALLGVMLATAGAGVLSTLTMAYRLGADNLRNSWDIREAPRYNLIETARILKAANLPPVRVEQGETPESVAASDLFAARRLQGFSDPGVTSLRGKFFAVGFVGVGLLTALRMWLTWWPLHPIGLLLCHSDAASHAFFSVFLAWLAKTLAFRIGGVGALRRLSPFFAGLLAGCLLGFALSWLLSMGHGLYTCHVLRTWTWETFVRSPWLRLMW